jgi:hypothetical protein
LTILVCCSEVLPAFRPGPSNELDSLFRSSLRRCTQLLFFQVKRRGQGNHFHSTSYLTIVPHHTLNHPHIRNEIYPNLPLKSSPFLLSPCVAAYASYRLDASRTASYPAVSSTIARSDTIRLPVPLMRQPRKTMHRSVVSHVKSICLFPCQR